MKTIIYKGRLITVTMGKPSEKFSGYMVKQRYQAHLESLWQSSTIHASKELMERFKDGEEIVEGKDYYIKMFDEDGFAIPMTAVPLPAVEEGSQDETWKKVIQMIQAAHSEAEAIKHLQSQYKITKI